MELGRWRRPGGLLNSRFSMFLILFLIVMGARLVVIDLYGNATPLGDEWLVDVAQTAKPYLERHYVFADLFQRLNEHLIFFTRLLVLSLLAVSGYVDVKLQMIVNAALDAVLVVSIAHWLSRGLKPGTRTIALVVITAMNAVPLSWDNILLGLNTHFYLVVALSFVSLAAFTPSRAWSARWALGCAAALGSYFCMASGALTFVAAAALSLAQIASGRRAGRSEWLGIGFQLAAGAILIALVPHGDANDPHHAHGLGQFLWAFAAAVSWPGTAMIGLAIWLPTALFALRLLRDRPDPSDQRWLVAAVAGWFVMQCALLAYGRASEPTAPRYDDVLLVGFAVHIVTTLSLWERLVPSPKARPWATAGVVLLFVVLVVSFLHQTRHFTRELRGRRDAGISQERNVRAYLETGDATRLTGVLYVDIPYEAEGLRSYLDDPTIRAVLPPGLAGRNPGAGGVELLKSWALRLGYPFIAAGLLLLALKASLWARARAFRRGSRGD